MKRRRMTGLLGLALLAALAGTARATNTPANGTITVTPVTNVSLSLPTTTYAFGTVGVGVSTGSGTGLTLTNNGQVGVTVTKTLGSTGGWTTISATQSTTTATSQDSFVLYVATAAATPTLASFSPASQFITAAGNALTGVSGSAPTLAPSGGSQSATLWFRLDMPTSVASGAGQTLNLVFTGVAQ